MSFIQSITAGKDTNVGIWEIAEPESFFLSDVSVQKNIAHPHKRLQHLAGRKLLIQLAPDFPVQDIRFTSSGKPCLNDAAFEFSISHSENYAAAIVSRSRPVGIDIEKMSPKLHRIAPRFLSEEESRSLPENLQTFALAWSAKEAVYKWRGEKGIAFKKNIQLQPFIPSSEGIISCIFQQGEYKKELKLQYRQKADFVLVWVAASP